MPVGSQPKSFGASTPPRSGHDGMLLIRTVLLWTFQFVAQRASSNGVLIGRPEFQRKIPERRQPPITESAMLLAPEKYLRPRPKGSSQILLALIKWRISKSEFAYQSCWRIGFWMNRAPKPPPV